MPDWVKIRNEYINGVGNAAELSRKYGVKSGTIRQRAKREGWAVASREQRHVVVALCNEKTAEAVAAAEADRIATLMRIGNKAADLLEKRLDKLAQSSNKAYEVKAIMETAKIIRDLYKADEIQGSDDPLKRYMEAMDNA